MNAKEVKEGVKGLMAYLRDPEVIEILREEVLRPLIVPIVHQAVPTQSPRGTPRSSA